MNAEATTTAAAEEPVKPLSAFQYFLRWCDEEIRSLVPGELRYTPPLLNQCSDHWKSIPAEGKVHFENLEAKDNERYRLELEERRTASTFGVTEKKVKDPMRPKRLKYGFDFYCEMERHNIRNEFEAKGVHLESGGLGKVMRGRWAEIKKSPEAEPYLQMAAKDKQRYKEELEEYKRCKDLQEQSSQRDVEERVKEDEVSSKMMNVSLQVNDGQEPELVEGQEQENV